MLPRARVSALSDVGRDLVELVAVVPRRVDVVLVDEIDPSLRSGTAEAERTGLLEMDGDQVAFRHELVREAIENGLSGTRRTALNRAVLAALEKLDADLSRQAHHAAEANDHAAMVRILPRAARSAIDVGSHREAVSLLRVLAPHVEQMPLDEQADFYDLLAEEEHMVSGGGDDAIRRCIDIRRGLDDPKKLGRSLLFAGFLAQLANDPRAAAEWIDQGMAVLGPVGGDDLAMAHAQAAPLAMLRSDLEQGLVHADAALVHADDLGAARAGALITMGMARATVAYPDGIELLKEGHRIAETSHALIESARAALIISGVAPDWRDSVTAQRWIRWAVERAETLGVSTLERAINVSRAELEVVRGNLDEAEQVARLVVDDPRTIENFRTAARIQLAGVLTRTGRGEIESALGRAWESASSTGDPGAILRAAAVIAEHRWLGGKVGAGTVEEMMSEFRQRPATAEPWHVGDLALRLWLNGDIAAMPDDVPDVLSRLGRGDWRMAARWFAERDAPYDEAIALSLGDDAARLRALEILEDVGAKPFAAKLRAELRARGVSVPGRRAHATRDHPFGLTQRQSEVLELVRDGLSNADIGRRLFISERTVEHHVSAILTKLDVTTRAEAVDKTQGN